MYKKKTCYLEYKTTRNSLLGCNIILVWYEPHEVWLGQINSNDMKEKGILGKRIIKIKWDYFKLDKEFWK